MKKNPNARRPNPALAPRRAPTPEEVARHAYQIWEDEGRPADRHEAHWLEAEKQLTADMASDGPTGPDFS